MISGHENAGANRLALPVSERDHLQGPVNASVMLVEYGDYECPYTRKARPMVERLQQELRDRLLFVYRNFPLTEIHPHAQVAAEAAEAASAQGRFWQMHDLLFENQRSLETRDLTRYAAGVGLDTQRFERDLTGREHAPRVREDLRSGHASEVGGTPTFFVNGVLHDGPADLDGLLNAALKVTLRQRET